MVNFLQKKLSPITKKVTKPKESIQIQKVEYIEENNTH